MEKLIHHPLFTLSKCEAIKKDKGYFVQYQIEQDMEDILCLYTYAIISRILNNEKTYFIDRRGVKTETTNTNQYEIRKTCEEQKIGF